MKMISVLLSFIFVSFAGFAAFGASESIYNDVREPSKIFEDAMQIQHESNIHTTPELKEKTAKIAARDFAKFLSFAYQSYLDGKVSDIDAIRAYVNLFTNRASHLPIELQQEQIKIITSEVSKIQYPKVERDLSAEMTPTREMYGETLKINFEYKMAFFAAMTIAFLTGGDVAYTHVMSNLLAYGALLTAPEILAVGYGAFRYGMRPIGQTMTPEQGMALKEIQHDLNRMKMAHKMESCHLMLSNERPISGGLSIHL